MHGAVIVVEPGRTLDGRRLQTPREKARQVAAGISADRERGRTRHPAQDIFAGRRRDDAPVEADAGDRGGDCKSSPETARGDAHHPRRDGEPWSDRRDAVAGGTAVRPRAFCRGHLRVSAAAHGPRARGALRSLRTSPCGDHRGSGTGARPGRAGATSRSTAAPPCSRTKTPAR